MACEPHKIKKLRNSGYSFKSSESVMLESRGVIEGQLVFFILHPVMHIRPTYILIWLSPSFLNSVMATNNHWNRRRRLTEIMNTNNTIEAKIANLVNPLHELLCRLRGRHLMRKSWHLRICRTPYHNDATLTTLGIVHNPLNILQLSEPTVVVAFILHY